MGSAATTTITNSSAIGNRSDVGTVTRSISSVLAVVEQVPPNAFAFVMATGIVGTAFTTIGWAPVAVAADAVAISGLVVLVVALIARAMAAPSAVASDLRDSARAMGFWTVPPAFAVTAVLSSMLRVPAAVEVSITIVATTWFALTYGMMPLLVLRARRGVSLVSTLDGSWFLWVVATQSLAILAAVLGAGLLALALWCVGIVLYLLLAGLLATRIFGPHDRPGTVAPTAWIVMGATAISTLAAARLLHTGDVREVAPLVLGIGTALWAFGTWCVPFLLIVGAWKYLLRREPIRYQTALWSVVFPLGMYATATSALGNAFASGFIVTLGGWVVWVAATAWLGAAILGLRALSRRRRSSG